METFFTADPHFEHLGIMRHCQRPWLKPGDLDARGMWVSKEIAILRTEEMGEGLVANWNAVVGHKDQVIIVGDMAWKNHRKWINRLHGKKILIIGSHDDMPEISLKQFTEVHRVLKRNFNKHSFFIFHWPCYTWDGMYRGVIHVHGHCHARMPEKPGVRMIDVGVDVKRCNYAPINVCKVIELMDAIPCGSDRDRDVDDGD